MCHPQSCRRKFPMDFQGMGIGPEAVRQLRASRMNTYQTGYRFNESNLDFESLVISGTKEYIHPNLYNSTDKPTYVHHQLRYLLQSPTDYSVYYTMADKVKCFNPITNQLSTVIDLTKEMKLYVQITSIGANRSVVLAGGLYGELILKRLHSEDVTFTSLSANINSITNNILCKQSRTGAEQCILSNNDDSIRIMDLETICITNQFELPWAPNVIFS
jgi:hypothetical protein